jgi:hypothetical protein
MNYEKFVTNSAVTELLEAHVQIKILRPLIVVHFLTFNLLMVRNMVRGHRVD